MDVKDAIQTRRALRALDTRAIPNEVVTELVEAMRLSPSCNNYQPWRVVLVRNEPHLENLKAALNKGNVWAKKAPLIMAICGKPDDDCRLTDNRDYFLFGCGMSVGLLMLRATELGLIAHPIAGYDPLAVKKALNIPNEYVVITLVNCGYPGTDTSMLSEKQLAQQKERPARKPVGENFFEGVWGTPFA
ncbi:MAG: malonic semialdehyde reductase [Methanomassiliicoccales archaeon PtaU1.Bin124]|nr:MAG: malonic semialdehyde reductase [Methanomassiliicoccales archaeon PtaU1.Bin124]